jgi:hypothetical protein
LKNKQIILEILVQQGINIQKLDKGCLIFNTESEEGYKVLSVDSNRYDTKYWLEQFLGVAVLTDNNFYTKNYLKFCQNFAKDVVSAGRRQATRGIVHEQSRQSFCKKQCI